MDEQAKTSNKEKFLWRSDDGQTLIFVVDDKALCITHGGYGVTKPFDKWVKDNWTPPDVVGAA